MRNGQEKIAVAASGDSPEAPISGLALGCLLLSDLRTKGETD